MKTLLRLLAFLAGTAAALGAAINDTKVDQLANVSPPSWVSRIYSPAANSLAGYGTAGIAQNVTIGSGLSLSSGVLSSTGESPLTFSAPLVRTMNNVAIAAATGSVNGYLTAADWTTFNAKQPAGSYITALTGDVTAAGPGSAAATLATVNANTGSFGSSTAIPTFIVNGKGLITAASTTVVIAPAGTLTGATLAANVIASSLTSVGTLTGGATGAGFTVALGTSTVTGTLGVTNGGNGLATASLGDLRYGSGTNTLAALAGSTSVTMSVLTQTGNGTTSAAPIWTSTIGSGNVVRATSPTLVTPVLGIATATSVNGLGFAGTGTLTLGGSLTTSGAFASTFTMTGTTSVTFPTSGTLATTAGTVASITGTPNQIAASASTGAVTLSIPSAFIAPGSITATSYLELPNQAAPGTPTTAGRFYFDASNRLSWIGTNGFVRTFDGTANTASRIYVLPDVAGTVLLNTNPAGTTVANINSITSTALANLTLGTGTFGPALTFTSATGAATFAAGISVTTGSITTSAGDIYAQKVNAGTAAFIGLKNETAGTRGYIALGSDGTSVFLNSTSGVVSIQAGGVTAATFTNSTLLTTLAGGLTVAGSILGSGGSAPSNTTSGSNIFTAGIATSGPGYFGGVLVAASLQGGAPAGGNGAAAWKPGTIRTGVALTPSTTTGVQLDVGGTLVTLAVLSTNP